MVEDKVIRDNWRLVYFTFLLHGLGVLMPWNMFITAKSYFVDFKLNAASDTYETLTYATNFMQYVGFASQIPNFAFNWLNVFFNYGGNFTLRVVFSILVEIIIFVATIVLAMLDSSSWPGTFFWITMISVVVINVANGIYQNTIYGIVSKLPVKYIGGVVLGSNISGFFASIIAICSSSIFTSKRTSAIYYFLTAVIVLFFCLNSFMALPLSRYYRYYEMRSMKEPETRPKHKSATANQKISRWKIFKQAFPQLFNVFFVFFVSLAVFPAVNSDIKNSNPEFFISPDYFTAVTCFLTFNLFAMLGSLLTTWVHWPSPKYLVIPVTLRAVFIPLFLSCNYLPKGMERFIPVLISNEWIYWIITALMALSSGYFSTIAMMYAPQTVAPIYQVTAGMLAAAMLMTGVFSGVLISFIFPYIVAK